MMISNSSCPIELFPALGAIVVMTDRIPICTSFMSSFVELSPSCYIVSGVQYSSNVIDSTEYSYRVN